MIFIKISKKIWSSFLKFVLMTALIHIGVLIFSAIKNGNIKFLNYFQILGLTEFWPKITRGWVSNIISVLMMVLLIAGFLFLSLIKKKSAMVKN